MGALSTNLKNFYVYNLIHTFRRFFFEHVKYKHGQGSNSMPKLYEFIKFVY